MKTDPKPSVILIGGTSHVGKSIFDYLVELTTEADVRALAPDFSTLGRVDTRGIMVTNRADSSDVLPLPMLEWSSSSEMSV